MPSWALLRLAVLSPPGSAAPEGSSSEEDCVTTTIDDNETSDQAATLIVVGLVIAVLALVAVSTYALHLRATLDKGHNQCRISAPSHCSS